MVLGVCLTFYLVLLFISRASDDDQDKHGSQVPTDKQKYVTHIDLAYLAVYIFNLAKIPYMNQAFSLSLC